VTTQHNTTQHNTTQHNITEGHSWQTEHKHNRMYVNEKLCITLIALNFDGSLSAYCCKTCRAEKPKEHSPCNIGRSNPPNAAMLGSMCSGLRSPDRRYSAAYSRVTVRQVRQVRHKTLKCVLSFLKLLLSPGLWHRL
jgi:hypothetical protein